MPSGEGTAIETNDCAVEAACDTVLDRTSSERPLKTIPTTVPSLCDRARAAWAGYCQFCEAPGQKCKDCWLLADYCGCTPRPLERPPLVAKHVVVLMHHAELNRRRGSNTAKLLLRYGARLLVWGMEEHRRELDDLLAQHKAIVLFPSPEAEYAADFARSNPHCKSVHHIIVLDGGWKETRKMNQSINPCIPRCRVSAEALNGLKRRTRKYVNGFGDRVQTAGAFIALLRELGEDEHHVQPLFEGLVTFLESFESQLQWSGVQLPLQ